VYEFTLLLGAACVFGFIGGVVKGWPWWVMILLAVGSVVFFFLAPDDAD
jgi:hypothetical protein